MNVYQLSFTSIDGTPLALSNFTDKAILLVNTASECGFTPQYSALQTLWGNLPESGVSGDWSAL